jgi:hypothetical protein
MASSTQQALKIFTSSTLREARRVESRGNKRLAQILRDGVSSTLAQYHRPSKQASFVDAETAKRQEKMRAWAQVISTGLGRPN